ncbi:hypothetical protein [Thauera sp.]|uniref:hypothetical protein n=1 Tax=Thauera sp. TaxID=1905334 RepID=UPI002B80503C|nr:hypothetical protein [Thauera sp.]HRP26363.1 hypothetical protein [Thauera sp.]
MSGRFEDIQPGDQLEMPAHRGARIWGGRDERDPDRVIQIGIVTDRWYDPVDAKEYVGVAILRRGGEYGKPTHKHTIRGLATNGWRPASRDWIQWAKAYDAGVEVGAVVQLKPRR